jgi:hypothetical protein
MTRPIMSPYWLDGLLIFGRSTGWTSAVAEWSGEINLDFLSFRVRVQGRHGDVRETVVSPLTFQCISISGKLDSLWQDKVFGVLDRLEMGKAKVLCLPGSPIPDNLDRRDVRSVFRFQK